MKIVGVKTLFLAAIDSLHREKNTDQVSRFGTVFMQLEHNIATLFAGKELRKIKESLPIVNVFVTGSFCFW